MKSINTGNIRIDLDGDILFLTISKYKMFLASPRGIEAMSLYLHLMFTARLQSTNSVKAKDIYLKNGLGWGDAKLKRAKSFLKKKKLIEYVQRRNGDGTLGEQYINVIVSGGSISEPPVQETTLPVDRPTGSEQQMLEETSKCFNKKEKVVNPSLKDWIDYCKSKDYKFDYESAWGHYQSNGWKQKGGNRITDWKAAALTCDRRERKYGAQKSNVVEDYFKKREVTR
jgi:hypothetical protein